MIKLEKWANLSKNESKNNVPALICVVLTKVVL